MSFARATALAALVCLTACPPKVGDVCTQHSDCKVKNTYCSRAEICTVGCDDGGACASGTACVTQGPRDVCLETCTADADCPKAFSCRDLDGGRVCELTDPLAKPKL